MQQGANGGAEAHNVTALQAVAPLCPSEKEAWQPLVGAWESEEKGRRGAGICPLLAKPERKWDVELSRFHPFSNGRLFWGGGMWFAWTRMYGEGARNFQRAQR
ncbi:unnamed protein product, partial [Ectocarpus sp. 12 AP-2014]